MSRTMSLLAAAVTAVALSALVGSAGATPPGFTLTSSAFANNAPIPMLYWSNWCGGTNVAPPLAWSGAPTGTKSFAIVLDDPDAVTPPPPPFTHWITWRIAASATTLGAGRSGRVAGANDLVIFSTHHGVPAAYYLDYFGPCPPDGTGVHHYTFHLYALSTSDLPLVTGATRPQFDAAIAGKVLGEAVLVGTVDAG